jgi:hypothetical protein
MDWFGLVWHVWFGILGFGIGMVWYGWEVIGSISVAFGSVWTWFWKRNGILGEWSLGYRISACILQSA